MAFEWIHENPPHWDASKASIVGRERPGIFGLPAQADGDLLPGEWWRVEEGGHVLGYGWMDATWGDAEILLAVHPEHRKRGVGSFILDRLEEEAARRGLNYLYNQVRPTHPEGAEVSRWLENRRFAASGGERLLKRRVRRPAG